jgi:exodeoxyribonuclease V alpha subunit
MKATLQHYDFTPVDWHLANTLTAQTPGSSAELGLAAALASKRCRQGHVYARLAEVAGLSLARTELDDPVFAREDSWPALDSWLEKLRESAAVTEPERLDPAKPLVLSGDRLYLSRYYFHERALARRLQERIAEPLIVQDVLRLRAALEQHFSPLKPESERQRVAVAIALLSRLCIVTGGPGTGKTSAIIRLLGVLVEQARGEGSAMPRVLILAPTGKAASRIAESIRESKERLFVDESVRCCIPDTAVTIHRALGFAARADYSGIGRLAADILVVDEASMVDLALMRRLFDACAQVPRIILLGDPEQLESVLAGSVLAQLSANAHTGYSQCRSLQIHALTGLEIPTDGRVNADLNDCRIELTVSHRFHSDSGIGRLAEAVRSGQSGEALRILTATRNETQFIELPASPRASLRSVIALAEDGYQTLDEAQGPEMALAALKHFRILCGHRHGPLGVESINEALLSSSELHRHSSTARAVPILITENSKGISLYNGDVGVLYSTNLAGQAQRACFLGEAGKLRVIFGSRLPTHELAFAMTVHKSQGSELDHVVIVLPKLNSPLLTRELLYTAITRARKSCVICGTKDAFVQACQQKSMRCSGLREALAQPEHSR